MATGRDPSFSTHVLDNERGLPAAGVRVTLERQVGPPDDADRPADHGFALLADRLTDDNGRIPDLLPGDLLAGRYRIRFHAGDYFQARGGDPPFVRVVTIELEIADPTRHYHVPLLMTRYACTSYRGS